VSERSERTISKRRERLAERGGRVVGIDSRSEAQRARSELASPAASADVAL
jgi:hypothetical protein